MRQDHQNLSFPPSFCFFLNLLVWADDVSVCLVVQTRNLYVFLDCFISLAFRIQCLKKSPLALSLKHLEFVSFSASYYHPFSPLVPYFLSSSLQKSPKVAFQLLPPFPLIPSFPRAARVLLETSVRSCVPHLIWLLPPSLAAFPTTYPCFITLCLSHTALLPQSGLLAQSRVSPQFPSILWAWFIFCITHYLILFLKCICLLSVHQKLSKTWEQELSVIQCYNPNHLNGTYILVDVG